MDGKNAPRATIHPRDTSYPRTVPRPTTHPISSAPPLSPLRSCSGKRATKRSGPAPLGLSPRQRACRLRISFKKVSTFSGITESNSVYDFFRCDTRDSTPSQLRPLVFGEIVIVTAVTLSGGVRWLMHPPHRPPPPSSLLAGTMPS